MEVVTPEFAVKAALVGYARTYCGLSYDEADIVAEKALELAPENSTPGDLFETFDLVWGAAMSAGLLNPGDWNVPIHPLSFEERERAAILSDSYSMWHSGDRKRPKAYDDPKFVPDVPKKKKRKAI
jgi:hypothetical protein